MFRDSFSKYGMVYSHLWKTYGATWQVRVSYVLRVLTRICRLIILPIAISLIITSLSRQDFDGAQKAVLLFAVTSLTIGILTPLVKYIGMLGENKVYRRSTATYFSRLVNTDIDYFHSNLAGYLTTATRQYVDSGILLVRNLRERYIDNILTIIFPLGVILYLDIWLGLITLVLNIGQAAYILWSSHAIGPYRAKSRELYKRNSGKMADIISNILAVKSTAQEDNQSEIVKQNANQEAKLFTQRYTMQAKLIGVRELLSVIFFVTLLWLTVERMSSGAIGITAAILVVTYTTTILAGIYDLSNNLDEHDDIVDKIIPAFEILGRKNKVNDPSEPKNLKNTRGAINFTGVTFAYDRQKPILNDLTLAIPPGQKIGIVGLSGAGKSTLVKLLMRFDDVSAGKIQLDDIDIKDVRQTDLRTHIAYVPQEPLLFHSSIRDNILLSWPEASDKDIEKALKAAHAWKFVQELPEGIESIVGERGVKLSGGQKQRIAIARAVLQRAPIMVLDEATSALDSESEQIIKNSFAEILKGKTAIVIAHRLSTLSEMDRIIVIDNGKLVEDGTHDLLLRKKGLYASLWQRQQKGLE
jgi:ATP-binding cassette subfamily B protein